MAEKHVFIDSSELTIEGLLENLPGDKAVVVTHPHPLYGGDMRNNVVEAVIQAYQEKGYSTLRFNFRGVGASQGAYDNGVGEQEDVRMALRYLSGLGKKHIDLVGYSFGAWVNGLGLETFQQAERLIMVSPPVNSLDFGTVNDSAKIQLVIVGTHDDIAGTKAIEAKMPVWNPAATLRFIEDADHFYGRKATELRTIIHEFLEQ